MARGYRFGRSKKERQAREAILHAGAYALAHRKRKKSDFRRVWNTKISAGSRPLGISYSRLISALNKKSIKLNRKILAELAEYNPETFKKIIERARA